MFVVPAFNPVAAHIGSVKIYWYGLMYLLGFFIAWYLGNIRARAPQSGWTATEVSDLIFYAAFGVILGGRCGYMLFYQLPELIAHPGSLLHIWEGGMSFHGGLIGVLLSLFLFCRKYKKTYPEVADFIAPLVPLGLAAGRIGNFINGELYGRATTVPWGAVYPNGGPWPRHPSQIYEFLLEGVLLFTIMWLYSSKPRARGAVSGLFLMCYGTFRIIAECFRQPDPQYGYLAFHWLTMGQILSVPMVVIGALIFVYTQHCKGKTLCSNI